VPDMPGKRDPLDFVLWQPSAPGEPSWPSPWGAGRPGWHVECSAMSTTYLGPHFEIHGGGADLAFPHHESEIAQSEAASGQRPFVEFWVHVGMVRYEGAKMSKSLGNLVLVRDLLRTYPADAIRYALLAHHYREEFDFDHGDLDAAVPVVERLASAAAIGRARPASAAGDDGRVADRRVVAERARFLAALDDDLDTPSALPALRSLADLASAANEPSVAAEAGSAVGELAGEILGLRLGMAPAASRSATAATAR
jgi:L-cysteine:1D-myo-inositol 2-amino-2-deoxy-alpha-D-glucopyranoside ligase